MKKSSAYILISLFFSHTSFARECPEDIGNYGNNIHFQDVSCISVINEKRVSEKVYRTISLNDEGVVQVMSSTKAATLSASMGFRVFYLFPLRAKRKIQSHDESHLQVIHPSGVQFNFDKFGNVSSPDLKMSVSSAINLQNKAGIEIESFPEGIVIDIGYRIGKSPSEYENKMVTITDKNQKKCSVNNNELFKKKKYDVEFIYKTNVEMYHFLEKRCKGLDLSDFLDIEKEKLKNLTRSSTLGSAPRKSPKLNVDDSKRETKNNSGSEVESDSMSDQKNAGR